MLTSGGEISYALANSRATEVVEGTVRGGRALETTGFAVRRCCEEDLLIPNAWSDSHGRRDIIKSDFIRGQPACQCGILDQLEAAVTEVVGSVPAATQSFPMFCFLPTETQEAIAIACTWFQQLWIMDGSVILAFHNFFHH